MNKKNKPSEPLHFRLKPVEVSMLAGICLLENLTRSEAIRRSIRVYAEQCGITAIAGFVVEKEVPDAAQPK